MRREQQQQQQPGRAVAGDSDDDPGGRREHDHDHDPNNVATPKDIIVPLGSQVTFINNDNRQHDMESNPHPEHTECPAIAQAGFLNPGQSRQTGNLTTARICGYHDHILADVAGLQGSITVR